MASKKKTKIRGSSTTRRGREDSNGARDESRVLMPTVHTENGKRIAHVDRKTRETAVKIALKLDGSGRGEIATGVPFLDHMLDSFARHGFFDLKIEAKGDLHIDEHHTVEDVGIVLGKAFAQALGDRSGIKRFGEATVPLDEALCSVVVDISGRSYLAYNVPIKQERVGLVPDRAGARLHEGAERQRRHESAREHAERPQSSSRDRGVFKALARAMDQATSLEPRVQACYRPKAR